MKNIAIYISVSRIVMSVFLAISKTFSIQFYIIYIYCVFSDFLDGYVARKTKTSSEIGARIDSIADVVLIFVTYFKIFPFLDLSKTMILWLIIIILIKIFNIILGYICHKKLVLLHTFAYKITGLLIFVLPLLIIFTNMKILEIFKIIICIFATFSAIQEGYYIIKKSYDTKNLEGKKL